jgi:hypothetical protein
MKKILYTILMAVMMQSCHSIEEWDNDSRGNFEALWTILDENYCFFKEKGVNWDSIHTVYQSRIVDNMTNTQLFEVCADMLNELKDGHTNLSAAFSSSYYRKWWSDYPQNYDERIVQENYLNFNYRQVGATYYAILPENIGYMRYPSFSSAIGESNLDYILGYFITCDGLIIDIRDNGGGSMTNVEKLVGRFITEKTLAGYFVHKTGPGHDDFSEPYPYYYEPQGGTSIIWSKPVVILTNRSTFSAANNFVSIMQYLPQCKIVGARTGGGSGMPYSSELPCGWSVRFSACSVLDAYKQTTEAGINPSVGCNVNMASDASMTGKDAILDLAIEVIKNQVPNDAD